MSTFLTHFHVLGAICRFFVVLWNAFIVFLQVIRSVIQEANKEAAEVMELLNGGVPMMDAITSTSLIFDSLRSPNTLQMLIISRASSFVLLLRLSKSRVLHLEVDEEFIGSRLEVIRTELMLDIEHVPNLLGMPIGIHDTRLVKYTPMKVGYLWKEERACGQDVGEVVDKLNMSTTPTSSVIGKSEGRSGRKKYVQLLTESTLRRRLDMDVLGSVGPKRGVTKSHVEKVVKRKALSNATNMSNTHAEVGTTVEGTPDETHCLERDGADTPKQTRAERNIHAALSENLSIPNMVQVAPLGKAVEGVQHGRRASEQYSRQRRSQSGLYAQGIPSGEFSLLSKMGQGRDGVP